MTLYHIGYVGTCKVLVFLGTNDVTSGFQLNWWLIGTSIWWILGFTSWFPNTYTLGIVVVEIRCQWTFVTFSCNNYQQQRSNDWTNVPHVDNKNEL
jgi:hypothetical protein